MSNGYEQHNDGRQHGSQLSGRVVRGSELLSGQGIDPQAQYRVELVPSPRPPQPRPERRVLVEVPESALRHLPPGARVVEGGQGGGRHQQGGQNYGGNQNRRGGGSEFELDVEFGQGGPEFGAEFERDRY